jgi:DNA-binding winged helix-turn-helix (wHTH) protein
MYSTSVTPLRAEVHIDTRDWFAEVAAETGKHFGSRYSRQRALSRRRWAPAMTTGFPQDNIHQSGETYSQMHDSMTTDAQTQDEPSTIFGPFRLFARQRLLLRDGKPVRLGSRAREILVALMERAGRVVKKKELIARVWPDVVVEEGTLRVHIAALRKALGEAPGGIRYIENVTGHGYRFVAPIGSGVQSSPVESAPIGIEEALRGAAKLLARVIRRAPTVATPGAKSPLRSVETLAAAEGIRQTGTMCAAHEDCCDYSDEVCSVVPGSRTDLLPPCMALACAILLAIARPEMTKCSAPFPMSGRTILDSCEQVIEAAAILAEILKLVGDYYKSPSDIDQSS